MADKEKNILQLGKKQKHGQSLRSAAGGNLVFAFDFGEFAVKVGVYKIKKNSIDVRYLFSCENKEGLSKLDNNNFRNWKTIIQREFTKRHLSTDDRLAVCTFGGKYYIHRMMDVAFSDDNDRNGLVANDMSQLLALDMDSYVFQNQLLEVTGDEDNKRSKVWAVAMPKETCDAAYSLIKSLKLKPYILDINANGINRFLIADKSYFDSCIDKTVACIDYGMTHTEIIYIKNGKIIGDTIIDIGDSRLVSEAKNAMGSRIVDSSNPQKIIVSPEDICNILNKAHATAEERAFAVSVEEWLSKINTSITRFNYEHAADMVDKIYVYGGSPQLVWLVQYISVVTKLPASLISGTDIFNTEPLMDNGNTDYSAYLNVLNLALMD